MKLNHKLIMVSAAALMSVSPLVANTQNSVQAATTTKSSSKTTAKKTTTSTKKTTDSKSNSKSTSKASSNNITLARNAYVYDKNHQARPLQRRLLLQPRRLLIVSQTQRVLQRHLQTILP